MPKGGQHYSFLSDQCAHRQIEQDAARKARHLLKTGRRRLLEMTADMDDVSVEVAIATFIMRSKATPRRHANRRPIAQKEIPHVTPDRNPPTTVAPLGPVPGKRQSYPFRDLYLG
jgi:hypothetical protein